MMIDATMRWWVWSWQIKNLSSWPDLYPIPSNLPMIIMIAMITHHKNLHFWRRWGFSKEEEEEEEEEEEKEKEDDDDVLQ